MCTGLPGDHLGGDDAFLLGLVREHRAGNAIADREDVRQVGAHLVVDEISPRLPTSSPSAAASMPVERRPAADRDEHVVAFDALRSCRPSRLR